MFPGDNHATLEPILMRFRVVQPRFGFVKLASFFFAQFLSALISLHVATMVADLHFPLWAIIWVAAITAATPVARITRPFRCELPRIVFACPSGNTQSFLLPFWRWWVIRQVVLQLVNVRILGRKCATLALPIPLTLMCDFES